jgi:periplasmic divalent cation tolerance protein
MAGCIQVVTTVDTKEHADAIGKKLLGDRLAACVQTEGPISSSYWWKGEIETAEEWRCIIKTTVEKYDEVEQTILSIHPYEEPEIIGLSIASGSPTYLKWIEDADDR